MSYKIEKQAHKYFIGLSVRTSNAHFQAEALPLWQQREQIPKKIPHRLNDSVLAVYTEYEGDHTQPFTYLIGCEVATLDTIPSGMRGIEIPAATYAVFTATGAFPQSMMKTWQQIWTAPIHRAYITDFEVYSSHFNPHNHPEVKIYIAIKP